MAGMMKPSADGGQLLRQFQAVAEETRFRVVQLLAAGERCVCDLQADLGAGQSRLSFHLKKLKEAGVVADRRRGRWVYYRLAPEALEEMRAFLAEVRDPGLAGDGLSTASGAQEQGGSLLAGCCRSGSGDGGS